MTRLSLPLLSLALLAPQAAAQVPDQSPPLTRQDKLETYLDDEGLSPDLSGFDGFLLEDPERGFELEFGGKMDNDWTSYLGGKDISTAPEGFQDGAELRRARLSFRGTAAGWLDFKASFDFTSSKSGLRDMWVQVDDLPTVGRLRIGHFKEPFGLERSTSGSAQPFLERSVAATLTPNRSLGFAFSDTLWHKQATWSAGVFRQTDTGGEALDSRFGNEIGVTGRFTFLPWYSHHGERLLHLGASLSRRSPNDGFLRFADGIQLHQSPKVVDTTFLAVDALTMAGLEVASVLGPLSFQGEYLQTTADLSGGGTGAFPGFYLQVGYFLTGETRNYSRNSGRFSWPQVGQAFHPTMEGPGAWELATRYSKLDLDDGLILGGVLRNASVGLNWYLNANMKAQLDYEYAELESFGNVQGIAARVEFVW